MNGSNKILPTHRQRQAVVSPDRAPAWARIRITARAEAPGGMTSTFSSGPP